MQALGNFRAFVDAAEFCITGEVLTRRSGGSCVANLRAGAILLPQCPDDIRRA